MRILSVSRNYHIANGADSYAINLTRLLEQSGHDVIPLAIQNPQNMPSPFSRFFVPDGGFDRHSMQDKLHALMKAIYPSNSLHSLRQILSNERIDIAHIHVLYHQITPPAFFFMLKKHNIPIVVTLHDYKLICPTFWLYIQSSNSLCNLCLGRRFHHVITSGCVSTSQHQRLKGTVLALEAYWASLTKVYQRTVSCFISPSEFLKRQVLTYGIPADKISALKLFISSSGNINTPRDRNHFLFTGRLVPEKGVEILVRAFKQLPYKLHIVGDGPLREWLINEISGHSNIQYLGFLPTNEVLNQMRGAHALIVPSQWQDNSPMVIYEAFASGTPVIAANVGGIPELVTQGETGFLFERTDIAQLVSAIHTIATNDDLQARMESNAFNFAHDQLNPQLHLRAITSIYQQAIATHS